MTLPVSNNEALIPRRPARSAQVERDEIDDSEIKPFVSYAPPGATLRARVRRLGDDKEVARVEQVDNEGASSPRLAGIQNRLPEKNGQNMVIKVEAEVSLTGGLPPEGFIIETTTHIRPKALEKSP